jgi:hypothetical protein
MQKQFFVETHIVIKTKKGRCQVCGLEATEDKDFTFKIEASRVKADCWAITACDLNAALDVLHRKVTQWKKTRPMHPKCCRA